MRTTGSLVTTAGVVGGGAIATGTVLRVGWSRRSICVGVELTLSTPLTARVMRRLAPSGDTHGKCPAAHWVARPPRWHPEARAPIGRLHLGGPGGSSRCRT